MSEDFSDQGTLQRNTAGSSSSSKKVSIFLEREYLEPVDVPSSWEEASIPQWIKDGWAFRLGLFFATASITDALLGGLIGPPEGLSGAALSRRLARALGDAHREEQRIYEELTERRNIIAHGTYRQRGYDLLLTYKPNKKGSSHEDYVVTPSTIESLIASYASLQCRVTSIQEQCLSVGHAPR